MTSFGQWEFHLDQPATAVVLRRDPHFYIRAGVDIVSSGGNADFRHENYGHR